MPVPTCCKLHARNYTCIPKNLGRRGTLNPTGQLVDIDGMLFEFFMNFLNIEKIVNI